MRNSTEQDMQLAKGWLQRQMDNVEREFAKWPKWMKEAAGIAIIATPISPGASPGLERQEKDELHCQECGEVITFNGGYNQWFHADGTSTYPKCTRPKRLERIAQEIIKFLFDNHAVLPMEIDNAAIVAILSRSLEGRGGEPLIVRCHCCKGTQIWKRNEAGEIEVFHDCASGLHAMKERAEKAEGELDAPRRAQDEADGIAEEEMKLKKAALARAAQLEAALRAVLASAKPDAREHPTMFAAWKTGRAALSAPVAQESQQ